MIDPIDSKSKLSNSAIKQHEIILIADPRILSISIQECAEVMIDVTAQKEIIYGPSPEIPNNTDYTKMRKAIYEKLYCIILCAVWVFSSFGMY